MSAGAVTGKVNPMIHPLPPHHPAARRGARADVLTLAADLSVIDRIEAAMAAIDRPRHRTGLFHWLLGRR
jgi:hypothetical protein